MPNLVAQVKRAKNNGQTALVADLYDAKFCTPAETKVLLHFDDEDNPLKDECGNEWFETGGNESIDTDTAKFGGALHKNSNVLIQSPPIFNFHGQPLTFDFWCYETTPVALYANVPCLFALYTWDDADPDIANSRLMIEHSSGNKMQIVRGVSSISAHITLNSYNRWVHFALTHSNDYWNLFVDGIKKITFLQKIAYADYGLALGSNWGGFRNVAGAEKGCHFRGYFDEFRFVDGKAVWTSNFTPPTQPYKLVDGHIPCRLQGSTQRLWAPFNFIKTDLTPADSDTT